MSWPASVPRRRSPKPPAWRRVPTGPRWKARCRKCSRISSPSTAAREALPRHAGSRVHGRAGQAVDAADPHGKRTAKAALKIAVELADEGVITARRSADPRRSGTLEQLLHPTIDPKAERQVIATGLPASPGAAAGEIVFSADEAEPLKAQGRKSILVRVETSPEDIHGMHAAEGILTTRGGMTSHAAVVARGMGKPCVAGAARSASTRRRGTMARAATPSRRATSSQSTARPDRCARPVPMVEPELPAISRRSWPGPTKSHARRARQRRHADRRPHRAPVRRRRHRALPHRAHVLRGGPHPRDARDDPRRRREARRRRSPSFCRCSATISPSCSRS